MNFKKLGIKIFIITIATLVLLNKIGFDYYIRLAIGAFGIGTSILMVFFGGIFLPEDNE
ncbi:MAG: hypothetical protein WBA54_04355 [Acidaminobacteraceae bacterium]